MAELRYKVCGPLPFAGQLAGSIVKVDDTQVDPYGRVKVVDPDVDQWVNLQASVAGGTLEPQSKDATALAETPVPLATTVDPAAEVRAQNG